MRILLVSDKQQLLIAGTLRYRHSRVIGTKTVLTNFPPSKILRHGHYQCFTLQAQNEGRFYAYNEKSTHVIYFVF